MKSDSISELMYFKIFKFYKIPQEILSNPEAFLVIVIIIVRKLSNLDLKSKMYGHFTINH